MSGSYYLSDQETRGYAVSWAQRWPSNTTDYLVSNSDPNWGHATQNPGPQYWQQYPWCAWAPGTTPDSSYLRLDEGHYNASGVPAKENPPRCTWATEDQPTITKSAEPSVDTPPATSSETQQPSAPIFVHGVVQQGSSSRQNFTQGEPQLGLYMGREDDEPIAWTKEASFTTSDINRKAPEEKPRCEESFKREPSIPEPTGDSTSNSLQNTYRCSFDSCGKAFEEVKILRRHERRTHNKKHRCPNGSCNKAFSDKYRLERHERTHTGERPYRCSTCGNTYNRDDHLLKHIRSHTGERPYTCVLHGCSAAFTTNEALNRHCKRKDHALLSNDAAKDSVKGSDGQVSMDDRIKIRELSGRYGLGVFLQKVDDEAGKTEQGMGEPSATEQAISNGL